MGSIEDPCRSVSDPTTSGQLGDEHLGLATMVSPSPIESGVSMVNGLSVDVEDYFHAEALNAYIGRNKWDSLQSRVVDTTRRVLELLAEHKVHGTFFVLGWVATRFPHLVGEIRSFGHEVACHSYWHRLVYHLSPEEFREDTLQAKHAVEDAAGVEVIGYRAPSFSVTRRSSWALQILCELGFRYDSSIFPVRHDLYGIPDHPRFACHHGEPQKWDIVEFPISTWRLLGVNLPFGGGGYLRILPPVYTRFGFRRVGRVERRPVIVYFHPWEIDPHQPRVRVPLRSRIRHYTNLSRMQNRIAELLRAYKFVPIRELWRQETATRGSE